MSITSNAAIMFFLVPVGLYHGPGVRHELVRDRDYVDGWPRVREASLCMFVRACERVRVSFHQYLKERGERQRERDIP